MTQSLRDKYKRQVVEEIHVVDTVDKRAFAFRQRRKLNHVLLKGNCGHTVRRQVHRGDKDRQFFFCEHCADLDGIALY